MVGDSGVVKILRRNVKEGSGVQYVYDVYTGGRYSETFEDDPFDSLSSIGLKPERVNYGDLQTAN